MKIDGIECWKGLFWTLPTPTARKYHIFRESDKRALCKRYMMLSVNKEFCSPIRGVGEIFSEKRDCKTCFNVLLKERD